MEHGSQEHGLLVAEVNLTDISTTPLPEPPRELWVLILKSIAMVLIMVAAAFGNLLVIISVLKFRKLRGITNYFIVSLAFADFLVATSAMPFNASMEMTGKWMFGRIMCDIFNSNDVLFSTASILHLCCISMDRYIAIMKPLQYESKMTKRRAAIMLCITWGASALISYIPIHTGIYTTPEQKKDFNLDPYLCTFVVNQGYAIVSSTVSFWSPCFIMLFVYFKIFREARRQEIQIRAMQRQMMPLRPVPNASLNRTRANSMDSNDTSNASFATGPGDESSENEHALVLNAVAVRQDRRKMRKEHKAAKTLGIIMGAFILCWFPFFLWYFISSMCGDNCPQSDILVSVLFWIGYFNSCLNPIIYAFFNREFRNAFKAILCCNKRRRHKYNGYDASSFASEYRGSFRVSR
ncbi:octopamine receptor beta-2R-like [Lineus longissimus]|uniref:octopamine receptor beta-2R-like n=1 Tax=Lineus longissimus TaxID=88925 RepID=UPI002B4FA571